MLEHNGIVHRMHIHNTQPLPLHAYHPSFQQFIQRLRSNTVKPAIPEHTTSLLPLQSRPFYCMPSSPKIVLSSKVLTTLVNVNPQHPRVRRQMKQSPPTTRQRIANNKNHKQYDTANCMDWFGIVLSPELQYLPEVVQPNPPVSELC